METETLSSGMPSKRIFASSTELMGTPAIPEEKEKEKKVKENEEKWIVQ
jgi:hypothetical protein